MASVELSLEEAVFVGNCISAMIASCQGDIETALGATKLAVKQVHALGRIRALALFDRVKNAGVAEGAEEVGPHVIRNNARHN